MSRLLINSLSDQVSALTDSLERAKARETEQRLRANRAETSLASVSEVNEARRRRMLAEFVSDLRDLVAALETYSNE